MRARVWLLLGVLAAVLVEAWVLAIRVDGLEVTGRFVAVVTALVLTMGAITVVGERRRPGRSTPPLTAALAILVVAGTYRSLPAEWPSAIGAFVWLAGPLVIADLLLSVPDGVSKRYRRWLNIGCWLVPAALATVIVAASGPRRSGGDAVRAVTWSEGLAEVFRQQRNPLVVAESAGLVRAATFVWAAWILGVLLVATVVLVRRWHRSTPTERRVTGPLAAAAAVWMVGGAVTVLGAWPERDSAAPGALLRWGAWYSSLLAVPAIACLPLVVGLLLWLEVLRPRLVRTGVGALSLGAAQDPPDVQRSLQAALDDPTVEVGYHDGDRGWIKRDGRPLIAGAKPGRGSTVIERDGRALAILTYDGETAARTDAIDAAAALVAVTIESDRLRAVTLARLADLQTSNARLLQATNAASSELQHRLTIGPIAQLANAQQALSAPGDRQQAASVAADFIREALALVRDISHGLAPVPDSAGDRIDETRLL